MHQAAHAKNNDLPELKEKQMDDRKIIDIIQEFLKNHSNYYQVKFEGHKTNLVIEKDNNNESDSNNADKPQIQTKKIKTNE